MSYGKLAVDWEEGINIDRMRKERVEKARKKAKEYGLESILLLHGDNIRYVAMRGGVHLFMGATGYRYALFPAAEKTTTLFEVGMRKGYTEDCAPYLCVKCSIPIMPHLASSTPVGVREHQLKKFALQIKNELKSQGLSKDPVGIDVYDYGVVNALKAVGVNVTSDGAKAMLGARKFKTKDEVECLRMIASIIESIFAKYHEIIKPGVTEMQLRGLATKMAYESGADWASAPDINSGHHTWPMAVQASDRAIRPGDLIAAALCSLSYNGYKSCYYRTFSCGRPNQAQKDSYAKTLDLCYSAIKAIKPGATTKDLAEKWPSAKEFGYPSEDGATLMQWGHGIGLGLYEAPMISRIWSLDHPDKIEPGMTFALETIWPTGEKSYDYPHGQATRLEEMLHVTETGVDILTKWPADEITVCEY